MSERKKGYLVVFEDRDGFAVATHQFAPTRHDLMDCLRGQIGLQSFSPGLGNAPMMLKHRVVAIVPADFLDIPADLLVGADYIHLLESIKAVESLSDEQKEHWGFIQLGGVIVGGPSGYARLAGVHSDCGLKGRAAIDNWLQKARENLKSRAEICSQGVRP